ncbi:MAG: ABC transporter permease [Opitutales bacterium]
MPWYIYLALKQLFPTGKRLPFFTVVSACGVMLGVMLLIIVQSVMNGFGEEIRGNIIDTAGHIRVESGEVMYNHNELMERLEAFPGISGVSPFAEGVVMAQAGNRPALPAIRGIDVMREEKVIPIEKHLFSGSIDDLYDDSILLSSGLASTLGVYVGSVIEVYSPLILERIKQDEILLPRELEVVGIFETGWNQIDSNTMVGTLRLMQDLYSLDRGIHGLTIRLHDGYDSDEVAALLNQELSGPERAISWLDSNRDFLWILSLEKNILFFLLLFIILVAAFAITSSLLITVVRKTREIGLLGALGGQPRQIASCFCFQGLVIGVMGTLLGVISALIILYFRNDIVYQFARLTQSEAALQRYYEFAYIPLHYSGQDFVVIISCSLIISTLAGLIPAWRAASLKPTEAFRNE